MKNNNDLSNAELAMQTLLQVCLDLQAPAAARAGAARTLAEIEALVGRNSESHGESSTKNLSELTASELDAEIKRLKSKG